MSMVFIISAPSGFGKSTLVSGLLKTVPDLVFSISYTTRAPRGNEKPGMSYYYINRDEFEHRAAKGEFLEYAEVFGNYYGTHRSTLDEAESKGRDLVLDIDVQGARQLKGRIPDGVSIFILAPSRGDLEQRLRTRSEDPEAVIQRRLREAAEEIRSYTSYDYVVVNYEVENSVGELASIVRAERVRRGRMESKIRPILATFR